MMIRSTIIWAIWVAVPLSVIGQGTFRVRFDQPSYTTTPDGIVTVDILIDPVPLAGLFSYGMKVVFNDAFARVDAASAVSVPPPLDFNGVAGAGADRQVGPGFAGVKGTVDFFLTPARAYPGGLLATVSLQNLAGDGSYPLSLELYQTLGPSESVFVSGNGEALDGRLIFDSALVHVIPETSGLTLMVLGLGMWMGGWAPVRSFGSVRDFKSSNALFN